MGRRIRASTAEAPRAARGRADLTGGDSYLTRLAKYLPIESIAVFLAVVNYATASARTFTTPAYFGALLVLFGATLIYVLLVTRQKGQPPAVTQTIVSALLFTVFAYATPGGPFSRRDSPIPYNDILAGILVPVTFFIAGFVVPNPRPVPQAAV